MRTHRQRAVLALAVALGGALAACGSSGSGGGASAPAGPDKINVGLVVPAASVAPAVVAEQQGYYKQFNLDATVKVIATGPLKTAVAGGTVQFGSVGGPTGEILNVTNGSVTVIGNDCLTPTYQLVAAPDITTVADLKGQPVGVTGAGSSTELFLAKGLKSQGLTLGDIKPTIGADTSALVQMFASGTVKAVNLPPPSTSLLLKALPGAHVLIDYNDKSWAPFPIQQTIVNTAYMKAHPDVVQRFMNAMDLGVERFMKDPAAAKQAIDELNPGLSDADEQAAYKAALIGLNTDMSPTPDVERVVLTSLADLGPPYTQYSQPDKASQIIDDSFAKKALQTSGVHPT